MGGGPGGGSGGSAPRREIQGGDGQGDGQGGGGLGGRGTGGKGGRGQGVSRRVLNKPRPVSVKVGDRRHGEEGVPVEVGGERIEAVRETWLVEDRWWTESPVRRRYWEVVSAGGRNLVVFHDLLSGRWFSQAA